jgi:hypothetical protein
VGTVLIVSGFCLALFGCRIFPAAVFLVGFSVTAFMMTELLYISFLHDGTQTWVVQLSFASLVLTSVMIGYLLIKLDRLGVATLSGLVSILVGILLDEAWLYIYNMPTLFTYLLSVLTIISFGLGFFWP